MACNCGGGGMSSYLVPGQSGGSGSWRPSGQEFEWVVTLTDGTTRTYPTDSEAYQAIRQAGGGGVRQQRRSS